MNQLNWTEANAEVARLREKYPAAINKMEAEIGPIPMADELTDRETIDSVIYMIRIWCMEVYVA